MITVDSLLEQAAEASKRGKHTRAWRLAAAALELAMSQQDLEAMKRARTIMEAAGAIAQTLKPGEE